MRRLILLIGALLLVPGFLGYAASQPETNPDAPIIGSLKIEPSPVRAGQPYTIYFTVMKYTSVPCKVVLRYEFLWGREIKNPKTVELTGTDLENKISEGKFFKHYVAAENSFPSVAKTVDNTLTVYLEDKKGLRSNELKIPIKVK